MFVLVGLAVTYMGCKEGVADFVSDNAKNYTFRYLYEIESQSYSLVNEIQANWKYQFSSNEELIVVEWGSDIVDNIYLYNINDLDSEFIYAPSSRFIANSDSNGYANKILYFPSDYSHTQGTFNIYDNTIDANQTYTIPIDSSNPASIYDLDWWKDDQHILNIIKETKDSKNEYIYSVYSLLNNMNQELFRDSLYYAPISVNNTDEFIFFKNTLYGGTDSVATFLSVYNLPEDKITIIDSMFPNPIKGFWTDDGILFYIIIDEYYVYHKSYSPETGTVDVINEYMYGLDIDDVQFSNDLSKVLLKGHNEILILNSRTGALIERIEYLDFLENLRKERFSNITHYSGWVVDYFAISPNNEEIFLSFDFVYGSY